MILFILSLIVLALGIFFVYLEIKNGFKHGKLFGIGKLMFNVGAAALWVCLILSLVSQAV